MSGIKVSKTGVKRPVDNETHGWDQKAICPRCKIVMRDCEHGYGEFWHPKNGCANAGSMGYDYGPNWGRKPYEETPLTVHRKVRVAQFKRKRDRRAKSLGARLARKLRPA